MRIYHLIVYDPNQSYEFHPTKKAAEDRGRALVTDIVTHRREVGVSDPTNGVCWEVQTWEVTPTREGIAKALNDFIEMTCLNEH